MWLEEEHRKGETWLSRADERKQVQAENGEMGSARL